MGIDDSGKMKPLYRIRPTFTPLPQSSATGLGGEHGGSSESDDAAASSLTHGAARDANEDDDLYDPYSDLHDGTLKPLEFERDPWK